MADTDWKALNHVIPEGWEKYVTMLAEACSAKNELILITRFQKIVRLIHDEQSVGAVQRAVDNAMKKQGW